MIRRFILFCIIFSCIPQVFTDSDISTTQIAKQGPEQASSSEQTSSPSQETVNNSEKISQPAKQATKPKPKEKSQLRQNIDQVKKSDYLKVNAVSQEGDNVELEKINVDSDSEYAEYNLDFSLRFEINDKFAVDVGISVKNLIAEIEEINGDINAYILSFNTTFHFMPTDQLLVSLTTSPAIASDFNGFDHRHFYFSGSLEVAFLLNKNVAISGGARLYERSSGWGVLPLLGLHLKLGEKFKLDIVAPIKAEASYQLTDVFSVFGAFTGTYHAQVRADQFDDNVEDHHLYSSQRAGGGIRAKIADNVTIGVEAGLTVYERWESNEDSGDYQSGSSKFYVEVSLEIDLGGFTTTEVTTDSQNNPGETIDAPSEDFGKSLPILGAQSYSLFQF